MLTVDVEALPKRAQEGHIDRLMYGYLDGKSYGIGKMMDIADNHGVQMTFFLDFASEAIYGDKLLDVCRYIDGRNHDVQLHLHPELLPSEWWEKRGLATPQHPYQLDDKQSNACIEYIVSLYVKALKRQPIAFRGGGFHITPEIINALGNYEILIDASYTTTNYKLLSDGAYVMLPPQHNFYWQNGVLELPITVNKWHHEKSQVLDFNGSMLPFSYDDFDSCAAIYVQCLKDYWSAYGEDAITSLVMHSWSLMVTQWQHHKETSYIDYLPVWFDYLLGVLKNECKIVTTRDVSALPKPITSRTRDYSLFTPTATKEKVCVLCGQQSSFSSYYGKTLRKCGICDSLERQRCFVKIYRANEQLNLENKDVLIVSPNNSEMRFLSDCNAKCVVSIDIRPELNCDIVGDICDMPHVACDSFDAVYCSFVLNNVWDDSKALNEIYRVLRTGGYLALFVDQSNERHTVELSDVKSYYGEDAYEKLKVGTFRLYGWRDVVLLLEKHFDYVDSLLVMDEITHVQCRWYVAYKDAFKPKKEQLTDEWSLVNLQMENKVLRQNNLVLQQKYLDLSNSKLGRIQLAVWKRRSEKKKRVYV